MTWFKVDDHFHSHRKVTALGKNVDALALWVVAGSWSADQLTDGFIPESVLYRLLPVSKARARRMAAALESAALWDRVASNPDSICAQSDANLEPDCAQIDSNPDHVLESGWRFHGWSERGRQPTAAQVLADRDANAVRVAEHRARKAAPRNGITNGVTNGISNRTPSRPVLKEQQQRAGAREQAAQIPLGAIPLIDAATAEGLIVSWDLTDEQWAQVRAAVERSGIPALVEHAKRRHYGAQSPARSARAWLRDWSTLPALNVGAPLAPAAPSRLGAPSEAAAAMPPSIARFHAEQEAHRRDGEGQPALDFAELDFGPTFQLPT